MTIHRSKTAQGVLDWGGELSLRYQRDGAQSIATVRERIIN